MRPLEPIYQSVFNLAVNAAVPATFNTISRRWVAWDQTSSFNTPALFQMQGPIKFMKGDRGLPQIYIPIDWYVYFSTDPADLTTVTSTVMNNYLSALIAAVLPTPQGGQQTLNNTVAHVYIDGDILFDEGVISSPAVIKIPIVVLTGI
jgi:hypothetical protein